MPSQPSTVLAALAVVYCRRSQIERVQCRPLYPRVQLWCSLGTMWIRKRHWRTCALAQHALAHMHARTNGSHSNKGMQMELNIGKKAATAPRHATARAGWWTPGHCTCHYHCACHASALGL